MTLSPMVINGLLIGGMIVVLLFILGVLNALSTSRKPVASVPAWAEIDDLDLDGRLNNLGAKKSIAGFGDASPAVSGFGTLSSPAPSRAATAERSPSRSAKSTRPNESTTAPSARFALPTSGRVQPPMATPAPTISGQGLNPLSARFSSMDLAPAPAPEELSPGKPSVQKPAATGANGILSSVLGRQDHIPAPAPRTEFLSSPADTAAQEQALPADDRSTPPEAARRFTEAPGAKPQSASRAPRPPVNPIVTRALPTTPQAPTRRLGLPGTVARGAEQGASQRAASFDIQALLRGEGGTAAPVPAVPSTAPLKQAPAAPIFSAVPLTPTPGDGAPLGAMPFDPNLLHAREPVETPASRVEAASNGVATKFDSAAAPGSASNGSTDFFGPARYEDRAPERMPATARPVDLDATHLVDGFDLPDSEFETHVFSTAELIDDHAVGSFSYPSVVADVQDTPSIAFSTSPVSAPVPEEPVALSSAAQARLQPPLAELGALVDVTFVRLIGPDGALLLSAGNQRAVEVSADRSIAELVNTAIMEGQQLELGACGSLSVEAPAAALLLSPLPGGACLAVLLSNPTRLGLLRRQVRKPLAALRAILTEHGLS